VKVYCFDLLEKGRREKRRKKERREREREKKEMQLWLPSRVLWTIKTEDAEHFVEYKRDA